MTAEFLNFWLSLGAIGIQIASVILFIGLARKNKLHDFISTHALKIALLAVIASVGGSLAYSLVIGFTPCDLCWYQRILLFPQLVLLAIAAYKNDVTVWVYIRTLSIMGAVLAVYHYYGQMFNSSSLPCPAVGPSCSQIPFVEFGYITIPMMSLSIFAFIIALSYYGSKKS